MNGRLVWVVFTHGKGTRYPLNRRLGGSQGGLDVFRREKNRASTPIRTPDVPARSLVTIAIALPSYRNSVLRDLV